MSTSMSTTRYAPDATSVEIPLRDTDEVRERLMHEINIGALVDTIHTVYSN